MRESPKDPRGPRALRGVPRERAQGQPHQEEALAHFQKEALETQAEAVAWTQTLLVVLPNQIRKAPLPAKGHLRAVSLRQLPAQALLLWRATRLSVLPARP